MGPRPARAPFINPGGLARPARGPITNPGECNHQLRWGNPREIINPGEGTPRARGPIINPGEGTPPARLPNINPGGGTPPA
ncbi:MAG TPA: hypothetical protein VGM90_34810 [Kofleriaceae bacterium]